MNYQLMDGLPKENTKIFIDTGNSDDLVSIGGESMPSQFYYYTVGYLNAANILIDYALSNKSEEELRLCLIPACFLYRQYLELTLKDIYIQYTDDNEDAKKKMLKETSHDLKKICKYAKPLIEKASDGLGIKREEFMAVKSYVLQFASEDPSSFKYRYPVSKELELFSSQERKINIRNLKECMNKVEAFLAGRNILAWLDKYKFHRKYEEHRSNAEKYHLQNDYPLALEHYKEALIWKKKWSEEHPDIVIIYCAMAQIYLEIKDFDNALCFYCLCADLYEKVDKDNISFTLDSIYNLIGLIYKIQKNYDNALKYYYKPLENPTITDSDKNDSYTGLARIHYSMNDKSKSEIFYQKAMNIRMRIFGDNHKHTIFLCDEINEKF